MSTNCIACVVNERTGSDLLCDACREAETKRKGINELSKEIDEHAETWHRRYMKHLMDCAGITASEAKAILEAGMGEHDYSGNPEDAAGDELSYWTDDE